MSLFGRLPSSDVPQPFHGPGVKGRSYDDEKVEGAIVIPELVISELTSRKVGQIGGFHADLGELLYFHKKSEKANEDTTSTAAVEGEYLHISIFPQLNLRANANSIRCLRVLSMKLDFDLPLMGQNVLQGSSPLSCFIHIYSFPPS